MPSGPGGSAGLSKARSSALKDMLPTHARLQACYVSSIPRKHYKRCKLLAVLPGEGQGTGPCGSHPFLTRKALAVVEMVPGNSGPLSTTVILIVSLAPSCHQLQARLWRQMNNQLEPVPACSWDPNQTPRKKVSRTLLEACIVGHQFPEGSDSFNAGLEKACSRTDRNTQNSSVCACV